MNNIPMEIIFIASIFILGLMLSYNVGILTGIGFVILANAALPTIIKLSQPSKFKTSKTTNT